MDIGSGGDTPEVHYRIQNQVPSLTAWTSRPIYPQCMQKYADAWRWVFPKIFALKLVRSREKNLNKDMSNEEHEFYRKELVVSLGVKFNNRDSPRDKTLHVKGGYLLPLIEG